MSFNITVEGGSSIRLPTAGKYCDRDIIVTAEGGGIALDVITSSALPDTVTDGQIVVITDTSPGTVYIDTDEPASPASGDVWVKLEAGADVALVLSEESPILRSGMASAAQWDGSTWWWCNGYLGVAGAWEQFSAELPPIGTALDDFTWEQIAIVSASGKAADYFAVGDAKEITINGTVGVTEFNNLKIWAFIIGIYHNPEYEGGNFIHFQIGRSAETGGTNLCLVDAKYNSSVTSAGYFSMFTANSNSGGWEGSAMRTDLLGGNCVPTEAPSGSLLAALPGELRDVMKGVTKYTDNKGGGASNGSYVTITTDYLWLLAEYEVFGTRNQANTVEKNHQQQYAYYASGNSKVFRKYNATTTAADWWLRSVYATNSGYICGVNTSGSMGGNSANVSRGICPCFCV